MPDLFPHGRIHPGIYSSCVSLLAAVGILLPALLGSAGSATAATSAASSPRDCEATVVHYRAYKGAPPGLAQLPWIEASPTSTNLVGHLFYYGQMNVWDQRRLSGFRIYSGGQSLDGRESMKILWELRRGSAFIVRVQGRKLYGPGSFAQQLSPTSSNPRQFPSIIDVPTAGCWRLTLRAGATTGQVVVIAVSGKRG